MSVLKCKMCAGELNIVDGASVAICEYCGTKQTVPSFDNEKKIALFGRANRLRYSCEFDKAAGVYESIVAEFPEEAEAYWGLVLCKYGIEYVDDPVTAKKIPTCHRSSFESVMEDSDFEQVMENADTLSRTVYREEAKQIEELRKGIIEVSNKEEPYDIFICYKETDVNGDRTIDSVMAQDAYAELVNLGYRVFFSRITLEDKLGQEFEPYIFAALTSARIMLVFGTDYEHFNAVWVKNEWSRYLQLIAKGEKKTLIPCYKNIDAYDMPKEFAKLQAQDMGKVGANQDLIRGIEKILPPKSVSTQSNQTDTLLQNALNSMAKNGVASTNAVLTRANQFLQTSEFEKANEYFLRVLDLEPTNSRAFLGQLLATMQCSNTSNVKVYIEDYSQYKFAYQYGDDVMREELRNLADRSRECFMQEMNAAMMNPNGMSVSYDTAYNLLWSTDEKPPEDSKFEKIKVQLCTSRRFDTVFRPAVAFYDSDCATIREVLPALETAVYNNHKLILFARSCDDELLRTLLINCMRGIVNCELVCINDLNKLREAALFCETNFNSGTVPNIQKAYIANNNLVLVK